MPLCSVVVSFKVPLCIVVSLKCFCVPLCSIVVSCKVLSRTSVQCCRFFQSALACLCAVLSSLSKCLCAVLSLLSAFACLCAVLSFLSKCFRVPLYSVVISFNVLSCASVQCCRLLPCKCFCMLLCIVAISLLVSAFASFCEKFASKSLLGHCVSQLLCHLLLCASLSCPSL